MQMKSWEILEHIEDTCTDEFVTKTLVEEVLRYIGEHQASEALRDICSMWDISLPEGE